MAERIDKLTPQIFLDGPAEFLSKAIALELSAVPQWKSLFGDSIDAYQRFDYSIRQLPALRIYNVTYNKQFESWFVVGDVIIDMIWPASIRREDLQNIPDQVSAAMNQQFRRPGFFDAVEVRMPGLNELGKTFSVDKGLGFNFGREGGEVVPLHQISVNFKVDLREWDVYLENNCRTKDDPFEKTLGELRRIVSTIQGLEDDLETVNVEVELDQKIDNT